MAKECRNFDQKSACEALVESVCLYNPNDHIVIIRHIIEKKRFVFLWYPFLLNITKEEMRSEVKAVQRFDKA